MNALTPDELIATTWVELFPWLDDYVSDRAVPLERLAEPSDWWLADTPAVTGAEADLEKILAELADLYVVDQKARTFAEAFPMVDAALPVTALRLEPVALTAVRRRCPGYSIAPLLDLTAGELFVVRGIGEQTVTEIVFGLLLVSVLRSPAAGAPSDPDSPAVLDQIGIDLAALAHWQQRRGERHRPLIEVHLDDEPPAEVQDVVRRITAITAADFPDYDPGDPVAELERLIAGFDEPRAEVLRGRLMAEPPERIGAVAIRLHLSKGRVRSLESEIKQRFLRTCDFGTAAGALLASIRADMRPVAHLDRLISAHPVLAAPVPSVGVPLWFALDRFDDIFEVTDDWAAAPNVSAARLRTAEVLVDLTDDDGTVQPDELAGVFAMPVVELRRWLSWCELPAGDEVVLAGARAAGSSRGTKPRAATAPARTRGLYRYPGGWRYRLTVTPDHLRGFGFAVSSGVADAFGCAPGTSRTLTSRLGPQVVRYTGPQPTCGTISRFLRELGSVAGDVVFLEVADDDRFDVLLPAADPGTQLGAALVAIGHRAPDCAPADAVGQLAAAVGLPGETRPRTILSAYRDRAADPVIDHLERAWLPHGDR
ncbi:hypothetical protein SKPI104516_05315 [Skermania piniformis]